MPRRRGDGKELFFATSYDHGQLMAVSIDASRGRLMAGVPRALLRLDMSIVPHSTAVQNFHTYAASHDGQRFLVPLPVATLRGETTSPPIAVVLNWTTPLED